MMLQRGVADQQHPLIVPYITENNYYEIKISEFQINGILFNKQPMSIMIDSGTTFSHFPNHILKEIFYYLSKFCQSNEGSCGRLTSFDF